MEPKINYFNQSMNEIVFEKKNRDYGAFLLRNLYRKHLFKALSITVGAFILGTSAPTIIRHFGWMGKEEALQMDTTIFILHAPPSINPFQPPSLPPPPMTEVKRPTEVFMEMEAAEKEKMADAPPVLDKKEIAKKKLDELQSKEAPLSMSDMANGNGTDIDGKVWNKVEEPPEFTGGEDAYYQFMSDHLIYPEEEKSGGIEGVTRVYFVINHDGTVERVKILRSSGNSHLDAEAVRLIRLQPKYKPGKQNGVAVKVSCFTDIEFRLK